MMGSTFAMPLQVFFCQSGLTIGLTRDSARSGHKSHCEALSDGVLIELDAPKGSKVGTIAGDVP